MHWIVAASIVAQLGVVIALLVARDAVASTVDACARFTMMWIDSPLCMFAGYFVRDILVLIVDMTVKTCFLLLLCVFLLPAPMCISLNLIWTAKIHKRS